MNTPDKCPKCGEDPGGLSGVVRAVASWRCGSVKIKGQFRQATPCIIAQRDQLLARIKRLEEAGDYWIPRDSDAQEAWRKAKEAQL